MQQSMAGRVRDAFRRTAFSYTDGKRMAATMSVVCAVVAIAIIVFAVRACAPTTRFQVIESEEMNEESTSASMGASGFDAVVDQSAMSSASVAETRIATIRVHVTGAVAEPGVYELADGARIVDALTAAGGAVEGASEEALNRACRIEDGQQVYLPTADEVAAGKTQSGIAIDKLVGSACAGSANADVRGAVATGSASASGSAGQNLVNINTASQAELEELPGVGPVIAQAIITYREQNGAFQEVSDLRSVNGIGDKKYAQLVDRVCI